MSRPRYPPGTGSAAECLLGNKAEASLQEASGWVGGTGSTKELMGRGWRHEHILKEPTRGQRCHEELGSRYYGN